MKCGVGLKRGAIQCNTCCALVHTRRKMSFVFPDNNSKCIFIKLQLHVNKMLQGSLCYISECARRICGLWTSWEFALVHFGLHYWFWCLWVCGNTTGSICWGERKRKERFFENLSQKCLLISEKWVKVGYKTCLWKYTTGCHCCFMECHIKIT